MDEPREHRCLCIVLGPEAERLFVGAPLGQCKEPAPLDAPYCGSCEDRHPEWTARGLVVTRVQVGP